MLQKILKLQLNLKCKSVKKIHAEWIEDFQTLILKVSLKKNNIQKVCFFLSKNNNMELG